MILVQNFILSSYLIQSSRPSSLATHLHCNWKPGFSVLFIDTVCWPTNDLFLFILFSINLLIFCDTFLIRCKEMLFRLLVFNTISHCYLSSWQLHLPSWLLLFFIMDVAHGCCMYLVKLFLILFLILFWYFIVKNI